MKRDIRRLQEEEERKVEEDEGEESEIVVGSGTHRS